MKKLITFLLLINSTTLFCGKESLLEAICKTGKTLTQAREICEGMITNAPLLAEVMNKDHLPTVSTAYPFEIRPTFSLYDAVGKVKNGSTSTSTPEKLQDIVTKAIELRSFTYRKNHETDLYFMAIVISQDGTTSYLHAVKCDSQESLKTKLLKPLAGHSNPKIRKFVENMKEMSQEKWKLSS